MNPANLPLPPKLESWASQPIGVYDAYSAFEILYPAPEPTPEKPRPFHWDNPQYQEDGWDEQSAKLRAYMDAHNLHYYARPKEDFFVREGIEEAMKLGKAGVVLDNLS